MGACLALASDEIDEIGGLERFELSVGLLKPAGEEDQVVGIGAKGRARQSPGCDRIEKVVCSLPQQVLLSIDQTKHASPGVVLDSHGADYSAPSRSESRMSKRTVAGSRSSNSSWVCNRRSA